MGLIILFQLWNIIDGVWCIYYILYFFIFCGVRGVRLGEKLKVIHFGIKYEAKVRGVRLGEKPKVIHFGIKYEAKVWRREEEEEEQVARI